MREEEGGREGDRETDVAKPITAFLPLHSAPRWCRPRPLGKVRDGRVAEMRRLVAMAQDEGSAGGKVAGSPAGDAIG
jgi:hypothetical protein